MTIEQFEVVFDEIHATFYSGQHITGHVVVTLNAEKNMKGIELKLSGKGEVHWSEGSDDSYSAKETYLRNTVYLVGDSDADITLPPGKHTYPFRLILPMSLPCSFEGTSGRVRYVVSAAIKRPWKFDHQCKAAFTVINPVDLNTEPNIQEPVQLATEKSLCCGCWGSPITTVLSLPFTGFVPGQTCHATVEVDNASSASVTVKFALVQVITYIESGGRTYPTEKVVVREKLGAVRPHGSLTTPSALEIPVLPDSYLRNCNCIDISYKMEIIGSVGGCHRSARASIPVIIGSIPLRAQFSRIAPNPASTTFGSIARSTSHHSKGGSHESDLQPQHSGPFALYPDLPPPTYEEYMTGRTNIRTEEDDQFVQGKMEYAPRYPMYRFR